MRSARRRQGHKWWLCLALLSSAHPAQVTTGWSAAAPARPDVSAPSQRQQRPALPQQAGGQGGEDPRQRRPAAATHARGGGWGSHVSGGGGGFAEQPTAPTHARGGGWGSHASGSGSLAAPPVAAAAGGAGGSSASLAAAATSAGAASPGSTLLSQVRARCERKHAPVTVSSVAGAALRSAVSRRPPHARAEH